MITASELAALLRDAAENARESDQGPGRNYGGHEGQHADCEACALWDRLTIAAEQIESMGRDALADAADNPEGYLGLYVLVGAVSLNRERERRVRIVLRGL